jgi:hypothetical protein
MSGVVDLHVTAGHARDRIRTGYRIGRVIAAEIFAEEKRPIHAKRLLLRHHRQRKRQT